MKQIWLMLCACLMAGLVSCSKDDGVSDSNSNIIGHWRSIERLEKITNVATGEVSSSTLIEPSELWLYDDGSCQRNKRKGTYKHFGNELNFFISYDYNAMQKDGTTKLTHVDEIYNYTIKELTTKRLVLYRQEKGIKYIYDYTTTYEKVN